MNMANAVPVVLTVAGSDSCAGAGVQADLKSIAANGGYGLNALTSVVSETPGQVSMVHLLPVPLIADQMSVLLHAYPIAAAKTGMLGGLEQVLAVVDVWRRLGGDIPLVVDPVMVATGGGRLLTPEAVEAVESALLPLAGLVTPNMDEAEVLWGKPVKTEADMVRCAEELSTKFGVPMLVKGGHLPGEAADFLVHKGGAEWLRAARIAGVHTHGTGCSYSAAIATGLACGLALPEAVQKAKAWLTSAIAKHLVWERNSAVVHALNHLELS